MGRGHQQVQFALAEQHAVHTNWRDKQCCGNNRARHRHEVDDAHGFVNVVKPVVERQGQQQTGEKLHAGLHHSQFLEQAAPVAIQAFGLSLITCGFVPALVLVRTVRTHLSIIASNDMSSRWFFRLAASGCVAVGSPG